MESYQQYPDDLQKTTVNFDAFIVAHSKGIHSYGDTAGLDNLVKYFIQKKYPYKIFHCYNPADIVSVLKEKRAKYLWIFGHGWRGGITFKEAGKISDLSILWPEKKSLIYENLTNENPPLPEKLFIGQFHCNTLSNNPPINTPLPEILIKNPRADDYYVTDNFMNHFSVWAATRGLAQKIKRESIREYNSYTSWNSK
jgi:hypothetical protein